MVDRRSDRGAFMLPSPSKPLAPNGRPMHKTPRGQDEVLARFSCGKDVEFDTLYPVFVPTKDRPNESSWSSSGDIDVFVASLPGNEMHDLHVDISRAKVASVYNYLWMLRWLNSCMELSEISRENIRARMRFHRASLLRRRDILDEHIEQYHQMCDDESIASETIQTHVMQGRRQERWYNEKQDLLIAMDIVDMLVAEIPHPSTWKRCPCSMCDVYSSSEWQRTQPFGMSLGALYNLPVSRLYLGDRIEDLFG